MIRRRAKSVHYALQGVITGLKDQPNLKIHALLAVAALGLGFFFQVSQTEWLVLLITIGLVLTLEFMNTAVEEIVDSFVEGIHPSAKKAKDVAAAAVLVASVIAIIVGVMIFGPHLIRILP